MVKKERIGIVVSDKPQKTIVVAIQTRYQHPKYKKTLVKTWLEPGWESISGHTFARFLAAHFGWQTRLRNLCPTLWLSSA